MICFEVNDKRDRDLDLGGASDDPDSQDLDARLPQSEPSGAAAGSSADGQVAPAEPAEDAPVRVKLNPLKPTKQHI